jgi:hypothetical protein
MLPILRAKLYHGDSCIAEILCALTPIRVERIIQCLSITADICDDPFSVRTIEIPKRARNTGLNFIVVCAYVNSMDSLRRPPISNEPDKESITRSGLTREVAIPLILFPN